MQKGMSDFAVIVVPERPPGLQVEVLGHDRLVLVASQGHQLAGRRSVRMEELVDEKFVCRPAPAGRRTLVDSMLRSAGLSARRIEMTLSHPEAIKQAVAGGVGMAVMFRC